MPGMDRSKALIFDNFGKPAEVIRLDTREVADPGPGQVRLRMLASPVHPSDFGVVLGKYGRLPSLPAIGGREGVAEIESVGEGVESYQAGDRVTVPKDLGAWQELAVCGTDGLFRIPSDIPLEIAAMATVNAPTAWRLLRDSGLSQGEWVVQNAANSAVGLHVIEMARHLGLKTLNVVRRPELIEPLLKHGADLVVLEDSGYEKKVKELTGGQPVKLALNSVGGESAIRLVTALSPGGIHVTFGAMQFEAVRFPTRSLIFDDICLKGFWMDKWLRGQSEARVQIMFDKIFDLMRKGIVRAMVDSEYPLDDYKAAFERASQPRLGKVLFRIGTPAGA